MFFMVGAAGSALDYLSSLQKLGQPSQTAGAGNAQASDPFALGNGPQDAGTTPTSSSSSAPIGIGPEMMNTLLSAQSQATSATNSSSSQLFSVLGGNSDGSSQSLASPTAATSGSGTNALNSFEQLIQRQAQSLMSSVGQSVSMNV
jgi:hypothetical protein